MKSDIKVLQICSYYLGTKLYQKLFDSLEKENVREDIYVFTDTAAILGAEYPENINISKCYHKKDRYIFHYKHLKVLKDIESKMKVSSYDLLHAHSLFSNGYIAYKLHKKYGVPYVVAVRNTDVNLFFKKMIHLRNMGVNILRNASKVVFISGPYKDETLEKYIPQKYKEEIAKKSVVIPNGIDEFWHSNTAIKKDLPEKKKINIIYVGTLDSNKNMETTIKACEILREQGYMISYKIIGKIVHEEYAQIIRNYNFITYIPHSSKEELINFYKDSDIFVMPSRHETFGLVYAEAMSQGLPVIYSRGQGFDGQFSEGEIGCSVQYDSPEEIAEKIIEITKDYVELSKRCVLNTERFNWTKIAANYIKIYEELKE